MPVGRTNRRAFIAALGGVAGWPMVARAQQSSRVRRIGVLSRIGDDPQIAARYRAFLEGLQQLGWTDGGNAKIDMRSRPPTLLAVSCSASACSRCNA